MAIELTGNWRKGFALDLHTQSSEYLGTDTTGRECFATKRTETGELVYRLKYRSDTSVLPQLVDRILQLKGLETMNCIVPVPPSKTVRILQPVFMVGQELAARTGLPFLPDALIKKHATPQLKHIFSLDEREKILTDVFSVNRCYSLAGTHILVLDDLFRSGSTLRAITSVLYSQAQAANVYVLALTKTRSLR
jgi:predicted amidophosphoribosyltransferase